MTFMFGVMMGVPGYTWKMTESESRVVVNEKDPICGKKRDQTLATLGWLNGHSAKP